MKSKILICGIQKTGNTYVRFVIFNYFNILNHKAIKTLTWDELQAIHLRRIEEGIDYKYEDGFPLVFHTHNAYDGQGINVRYEGYPEYFKSFDKMVYIYRNPYDTIISYYHFIQNRNGVDYAMNLEDFIKYYLPKWIHHVRLTKCKADFVLDYDELQKNPIVFFSILIYMIDDSMNLEVLKEAIEISSFENIRQMSIDVEQPYGLGGLAYKGFFCRDGRSGQYKGVMSKELIDYIRNTCKREGLEV